MRLFALLLIGLFSLSTAAWGQVTGPLVPTSETPIVIGRTIAFRSAVMGQVRNITVYLPSDYQSATEKRYPVLYVIDGGATQDFPHIAGLSQLGGLSGIYPEMIVVGIETMDRRNELTTPTTRRDYLSEFPTLGGAARFRQMIADEVIPYVDASYRTGPRRVVIGESLAAYFIVDSFLTSPTLFTDYIAVSPSMWWDEMALADRAAALLAIQPSTPRSLYLTVADEGGNHRTGIDRLASAVAARPDPQLRSLYDPRPTEQHSTIYHGAALAALRWTFQEPQ